MQPWCISQVVKAHEDCPELQAVLDEYHKPVVIQDQVLGELTLDKDYDVFEGEIQWCGKDVSLSLEVNAESKPSWTRARSAAKKLLADCETWDKAMRDLAAKMCIRDSYIVHRPVLVVVYPGFESFVLIVRSETLSCRTFTCSKYSAGAWICSR